MASSDKSHRMKRIHDYFFPHRRNDYRPNFFSYRSLGVVAVGLIVLQGVYLAQTKVVFKYTDFLAAVLPGVLTGLTNDDRVENGLHSLTPDPQLTLAAQLAVNDMATKGYFAHNSPDGKTPWYWLDQVGYQYSYSGQNLAVNFTDSEDVEQAWLKSPTHRANIMKREYTRIGIAVARGSYKGKETTFVVQYFATPRTVAAATQPVAAVPPPAQPTSVLGAATEPAPEPPPNQVVISEPEQETPQLVEEPVVEGPAQIVVEAVEEPAGFLARIATSPHNTVLYLLSLLAAVIAVLLAVAIAVHLRKQYVEVIGGGFTLLILVLAFMTLHVLYAPTVTLPGDAEGSTVEIVATR